MPMLLPSHSHETGFTLIEMLVVLVIMGLVLAAISFSFNGLTNRNNEVSGIAEVQTSIKSAGKRARLTGTPVIINMPEDWVFDNLAGSKNLTAYPDGSFTPGSVLTASSERYTVRWSDGKLNP